MMHYFDFESYELRKYENSEIRAEKRQSAIKSMALSLLLPGEKCFPFSAKNIELFFINAEIDYKQLEQLALMKNGGALGTHLQDLLIKYWTNEAELDAGEVYDY
jgi:hypothetical protein